MHEDDSSDEKWSAKIERRLSQLADLQKVHLELIAEVVKAANRQIFHIDFVVIGAIQRSLGLIDGFDSLVRRRNVLCAVPLVRMQLDSAMRILALSLVDDPTKLATMMMQGTPLSKARSREGDALRDVYLHQQLSKRFPWVDKVYDRTSGFIHLSLPHLFGHFDGLDTDTGEFDFFVGQKGPNWPESSRAETVEAFVAATECVMQLCAGWLHTKRQGPPNGNAGL